MLKFDSPFVKYDIITYKILLMGKLIAYSFITLNGFYKGPNEDISWHVHGAEENEFACSMLQSRNTLLFGRVTYDVMAGYWPTPHAVVNDPVLAAGMNAAEKIVFSRTLNKVAWNNTRLVKDNICKEIRSLKEAPGKDMTLLGSGNVLAQLAEQNLIDEYQIMVDPIVLADGTQLFENIRQKVKLRLTMSKVFQSGVVLLCYQPAQ